MKKYLFTILAMATVLVACETEINGPIDPVETPEVAVSLSGSVPGLTRVSSDNAGIYKFQENDEITVITDNNTMRNFTAAQGAGETASFEGTIPQGESIVAAFYPASEYESYAVNKFYVPTNIVWKQDASNMPMYATVVTTQEEGKYSAEFKAVGGVLKLICFNVPENATKMVFTAATQKIAGEFTITKDNNDNDQIVGSTSEVDNSITFDFSGNRSNNMVFYVPLPVVTLTGGFTIAFRDDTQELFSKTSSKAANIQRNHLVIAPALNCASTLWNEDFSQYSANDVPGSVSGEDYHGASGYACTNGSTNTKVYTGTMSAGGVSPELLVSKKNGSFTISGIPTNSNESLVLSFKTNRSELEVSTTTSGITIGEKSNTGGTNYSVAITNTNGAVDNFTLVFANPSGNNARLDDIALGKGVSVPTISVTPDTETLTIPLGSTTATVGVTLTNPIDNLGISAILDDDAEAWVESAVISDGTLTVTAKGVNSSDADYTGTLTLKATGATKKTLNLVQESALVPNPDDLVAIAGNGSVTATWTKNANAKSYLAYLHTSSTDTPAEGGEALTPTLNDGIYTITKDGLTNDQEYWLYVKVNEVEDNYVAPTVYVYTDFTPAEAKGTESNPYTASELYDLISGYDSGKGPEGTIYVKGYVSTAYAPSNNSQRYKISDDGTTTKEFQIYNGKGISGVDITSENRVNVGDWVVVSGTAVNYSGNTPQFSASSTIITHNPKLAAPTFTPAAGTYYSAQSVVISAAEGATIYYTTDETDPTTESTVYTEPIAVTGNMTLKAIAVKENFVTSAVATAAYEIEAATKLDTPVITVDSFNHNSITFSWAAIENATGYQVSTNGGTDWSDTQEELTYTWTGLNAETEYTIYVKAIGTTSGQYTDSDAASKSETTAAPKTLVSIALTTNPTQTTYNVNDTFSLAGAVVTATYSDESTADVTASCTTEYDFSTTGNKTVTISYTEGSITRTCDCNVTVAIVDKLTRATTGASGTNYSNWSEKSKAESSTGINSTAVYAGNSAGGNESIQLRATNPSGIVTTATSEGNTIKKISVKWNSNTADARTLDVYAKNTAYSSAGDLYSGTTQGTLVHSFTKSAGDASYTFTTDYEYIGIRSNSGALYLDEIDIEWTIDSREAAGILWTADGNEGEAVTAVSAAIKTGIDDVPAATLYNPNGLTVSYSSDHPEFATIDASSGVIALKSAGTTTITATFAGNYDYKEATVSYTLTVTDSRETCETPTFNPAAGAVDENTVVTISSATTDATIYYTTDNSEPTTASTQGNSVTITGNVTIKAIAVKDDYLNSAVATAAYTLKGTVVDLNDPSEVSIESISATGFTAIWTAPATTGAPLGYDWKLTKTADGSGTPVAIGTANSNATSVTVTNLSLTADTDYYFHVKATGDGTNYNESNYASSGKKSFSSAVRYSFTITANDFNTTSYAANNNAKETPAIGVNDNTKTLDVSWTSNQVMKNGSNMQWQKSKGYIYNSTDLGTIISVTVTSSAGTFTTYYGTSSQPTSGTSTGSGKGYFKTNVGSATGTTSQIVIVFEK